MKKKLTLILCFLVYTTICIGQQINLGNVASINPDIKMRKLSKSEVLVKNAPNKPGQTH